MRYEFVTTKNCNYPGNDISELTLNSVTECGNTCYANVRNYFLYNPNLKLCNLKWADSGSLIGILSVNCDYPGNDLVTKKFKSLDECIKACISDAQCTHFGYRYESYGGDCMFKKAGSNPIINYDAYRTCGYIS